jgi:hypothetical protein
MNIPFKGMDNDNRAVIDKKLQFLPRLGALRPL